MEKFIELIKISVLAGICIGIAGFGYLAQPTIIGAVLFSFGLISVIHYGLYLYTGKAGFVKFNTKDLLTLILGLLSNIVGCVIVSLIARCSHFALQDMAQTITDSRLSLGLLQGFGLSIGCGFIMTTSVTFAKNGKYLPLIFGVPLFIMCGFPHCVADAFYYACLPLEYWAEHWFELLKFYACIVIGNFVGCNLVRSFH